MSTSSSSSSHNTYTHDEQEQLSSTSSSLSSTKKIRTFDVDLYSDEDVFSKNSDIFLENDVKK